MKHKVNHYVSQLTITLLIVLSILFCVNQFADTSKHIVIAQSSVTDGWNATIALESDEGSGFTLTFGETSNASDGIDPYDTPAPPSPPEIPHINARFLTSLDPPYTELITEYKSYPDSNKTWNFSLLWFAGPQNTTTTTITITWDSSALQESEYDNIVLKKNNTLVKNMLTLEEFSYTTESNIPSFFSIVCTGGNINNMKHNDEPVPPTDTPFPSVSYMILLVLVITLLIYKIGNKEK